jgi:hypothetical protein
MEETKDERDEVYVMAATEMVRSDEKFEAGLKRMTAIHVDRMENVPTMMEGERSIVVARMVSREKRGNHTASRLTFRAPRTRILLIPLLSPNRASTQME